MGEHFDNGGKRWVSKGNSYYSGDGKVKLSGGQMKQYLKGQGGGQLHESSSVSKSFKEAGRYRDEVSRKTRNGEDIRYKV